MRTNAPISSLSSPSTQIQSLERHVRKWIAFSLNLLELWQCTENDTRKIKLKKIRLSNQCQKSLSDELPRVVDMLFEVKDDITDYQTQSNNNQIIMTFSEEFTTVRLILCSYSSEYSSVHHVKIDDDKSLPNNIYINDIARKEEDVNAFICIQPCPQIKKLNFNSQPLFKLTFDSL